MVDALAERDRPTAPDGATTPPPAAEDNPLNAWYVTADVTGSGTGPLAGKRVAVKDNIMVAGVPMMNGSRSLEGFVPVEDATVVTRCSTAGGTVAGKSVCEDLCFSGGSHTRANGAGAQPLGPQPLHRRLELGQRRAGRGGRGRHGHRRRPGRLGADAGVVVRDRRAQAHARAGALHRCLPHRGDASTTSGR